MLRKLWIVACLVAVLALASRAGSKPSDAEPAPHGVLAVLRPGLPVSVKEAGGRYEIALFPHGPPMLGYTVRDVGPDYVIVEDIAGVTELRIPLWSIQVVSVLKMGRG